MTNIFLSLVSGFITTWAFPPLNIYLLTWVALIPFFYVVISESNYKKTFWAAALFGCTYFGILISSFSALYDFAPKSMINTAMVLYTLSQTLFIVIIVLSFKFFQRNLVFQNKFLKIVNEIFCLTALWIIFDWLRSLGVFGNTLGDLAYSQYQFVPFIQLAKYTGPYGLTFVLVFFNATLAYAIKDLLIDLNKNTRLKWLIFALGIFIVFFLGGLLLKSGLTDKNQISAGETKEISIFQPAVPQSVKLDNTFSSQLKKMYINNIRAYSQLKKTDLIVLPETIIPEFLLNDKEFMFNLRDAVDSTIIFGTPRFKDRSLDNSYFNGVVLMNKFGDVTVLHDKKYLVPFGEYIPFRKLLYWFFRSTDYFETEYAPGEDHSATAGYACAVCFESTLPYQLREQVKSGGNLLVVITNDAWYKKTVMLEMHLSYAVFRAVENNRWLVQAANTGISGIIDNFGRIRKQSQIDEKGWLEGRVELLTEKTIYTVAGEIAVYLAFIYMILMSYILLINLPKNIFNELIEKEKKQNKNNPQN